MDWAHQTPLPWHYSRVGLREDGAWQRQVHLDSSAVGRSCVKLCFPTPQSFPDACFQPLPSILERPLIFSINSFSPLNWPRVSAACIQRTLSSPPGEIYLEDPCSSCPCTQGRGQTPAATSVQCDPSPWQWLASLRRHPILPEPITHSLLGIENWTFGYLCISLRRDAETT